MPMLEIWTIYDHPSDCPGAFIARKWVVRADGEQPTHEVMLSPELEPIRAKLASLGLTPLPRNEADDPTVVESWL